MNPEQFLAFDPGKTIGVAYWRPDRGEWDATQTKDPFDALRWGRTRILAYPTTPMGISIEKFAGGGYKTHEGIYTTELVGFYTYWFKFYFKVMIESGYMDIRNPLSQHRLSGLETATKWAQSMDIEGPHSWDALAHTIVHAREYNL